MFIVAQNHHIIIRIRTLKRHRGKMGRFRRKLHADVDAVLASVHQELQHNGQKQGYRWLHRQAMQRGAVKHNLTVYQMKCFSRLFVCMESTVVADYIQIEKA